MVAPALKSLAPIPFDVAYLWDWYEAMSQRRTAGFSINAITWSDMQAFYALNQISPEPWEVNTICRIDSAFLASRVDPTVGAASVSSAGALKNTVTAKK